MHVLLRCNISSDFEGMKKCYLSSQIDRKMNVEIYVTFINSFFDIRLYYACMVA